MFMAFPLCLDAMEAEPAKLNTDDAGTISAGAMEIELTATDMHATRAWDDQGVSHDRGGHYHQWGGTFGIAYGLMTDLDVHVTVGYTGIDDYASPEGFPFRGKGSSDLVLESKWRFMQRDQVEMALKPLATLPTTGHVPEDRLPTTYDHCTLGGMLIVTGSMSSLAITADVGAVRHFRRQDDQPHSSWCLDVACGWQIVSWLQPELEVNYAKLRYQGADLPDMDIWAMTAGFLFPTAMGRFALGIQQGLRGHASDQSTLVMGQWCYEL
jgi:hypothetical protein